MNWNRIDLRWAYTDLLLSLGRRTGCMHLAYDVLHDAFIRYLVADRQTRIEQPNACLRRVAQTVLIDHFRQSGRFCSLESSEGLPADHPDQQRLREWLAADPRHAQEYQAFAELWGDFSSTASTRDLAGAMEQRHGRRAFVRRGALGLFGLLAIGLGWRLFGSSRFEQDYVTAIGERRRERLPDGSELYLGADTRLRVLFDKGRRQVWLLQGEAIFDVVHDSARVFAVDAGLARVTVLGTRFVVARTAQELRVSVERGRVRMDNERGALLLGAGQVASNDAANAPRLLPIDAGNAFAFERGRLVLQQAGLDEIASSLSRYRRQAVRVEAGKGQPRIDAVVQLDAIEGFLQALPSIAPITVSERDGITWLRAR